jgi:hypothetical protein
MSKIKDPKIRLIWIRIADTLFFTLPNQSNDWLITEKLTEKFSQREYR